MMMPRSLKLLCHHRAHPSTSSTLSSTSSSTSSLSHLSRNQTRGESTSTFMKWFNNARNSFRVMATPDDSIPARVQEKNDIHLLLLSRIVKNRLATTDTQQSRNYLDHVEPAITELDRQGVLKLSNFHLRYHLQNEINPDLVDILLCLEQVLDQIPGQVEDLHGEMILTEHQYTSNRILSAPLPQQAFLRRKLGALETLMSYYEWTENPKRPDWEQHALSTDKYAKLDDFGYDGSESDPKVLQGMREYQTVNMCRSVKIREHLGYSCVALKSTIRGAGRGVFIDGECPIGTLLAFIPGEVWPKEHLEKIGTDAELREHFSHNPLMQIFGRGDDILIDARRAPYTVLDHEHSNQWAIGHIANHPPKGGVINCRKVPINFTERDFGNLMHVIPNTYARKPAILGQGALSLQNVSMHGLGLMARLNLCDQELFYNYRLKPADGGQDYKGLPIPEWFHEEFKAS